MSRRDLASRVSERVYWALLVAYPKRFRETFGPQMVQIFRDLRREESGRRAISRSFRVWARVLPDLAAGVLRERFCTMPSKLLVPLAIIAGLAIALVDSSPGWDDTGTSAAVVFASCSLLGAVYPARPWVWALLVGLWIPALGIALHQNYASLMALAVALAGAYLGTLVRRTLRPA